MSVVTKSVAAIATSLIAVAGLAGCGGDSKTDASKTTAPKVTTTTTAAMTTTTTAAGTGTAGASGTAAATGTAKAGTLDPAKIDKAKMTEAFTAAGVKKPETAAKEVAEYCEGGKCKDAATMSKLLTKELTKYGYTADDVTKIVQQFKFTA